MNKNEIANEIQETERKLADLRKRLEEPEEWLRHAVGHPQRSGASWDVTLYFDTREQAAYARPILEKMNFNKPPADDEMVTTEVGDTWPYRACSRTNRDSRWHMGAIKRAK